MFMFELKISRCIFPSASYVIAVIVVVVHMTSFSYFKCMSELTQVRNIQMLMCLSQSFILAFNRCWL